MAPTVRQKESGETVLTSKGQLTLPASIRQPLDLRQGDRLHFEITGPDRLTVTVRRKRDVFELLASLPPLPPLNRLERADVQEAALPVLEEKLRTGGKKR